LRVNILSFLNIDIRVKNDQLFIFGVMKVHKIIAYKLVWTDTNLDK